MLRKSTFLGMILLISGFAQVSIAQTTQPASETPNLIHDRHTHATPNRAHGHSTEEGRFVTSRPDALQLPLPEEKDAFSFVVFGDRTGGQPEGVNILADAVRDVNLIEPDFVITVGDLVQGYNETPLWMQEATEFKAIMDKLLCPWFPVAGNHDVYWRDKDGSGDLRPSEEHEKNYEMHFGPLWYAFKHKNSWFFALYTDEANPKTGERNFNKPENHEMSQAQFDWLAQTLEKAKDADHVFLFMHHPRWTGGGNYGKSWDRVHELLKQRKNVSAVFGGHIHRMRFDEKDGIEYVTLATTGGGQNGGVPNAGLLHHYHVVTVRKDQVALTAFPVGEAMNVREITAQLQEESVKLLNLPTPVSGDLKLEADGSADGELSFNVANPSSRPIDATASLQSADSRWSFYPDHDHAIVKPGESRVFKFRAVREGSPLDHTFRPAEFVLERDYLAPSARYTIPETRTKISPSLTNIAGLTSTNRALRVDSLDDALLIPDRLSDTPAKAMTVECWFMAESFPQRAALLSKAQGSDYGLFISGGVPQFSIFAGEGYVVAKSARPLKVGQWYHLAGQYDGERVSLFIDGKLAAMTVGSGELRRHNLPLTIGADVNGDQTAVDPINGVIDSVRISKVARYKPTVNFKPAMEAIADEETVLAMNFDFAIGTMLFDESSTNANPTGDASKLVERMTTSSPATQPSSPTTAPSIGSEMDRSETKTTAHRGAAYTAPGETLAAALPEASQNAAE